VSNSEDREREASSSLDDVAAEIGDGVVDTIAHTDVLEHIPIAKLGVAAVKLVGSVRDRLLFKKLLTFLRGLSAIPRNERAEMIERLQEDRHYAESVGEHLIELLDRLDGRRKVLMAAAVFRAFADKKIDIETVFRLTHAIDVLQTRDLPALRSLTAEGPYNQGPHSAPRQLTPDQESLLSLTAASLVNNFSVSPIGGNQTMWRLTNLGEKFLEMRLDLIPYKED
jgi:hypothetical protein